jgi:hypothetical protein
MKNASTNNNHFYTNKYNWIQRQIKHGGTNYSHNKTYSTSESENSHTFISFFSTLNISDFSLYSTTSTIRTL